MIRMATTADIPAMLAIYGPYVLESTYTFEYTVPTQEEFTRRFLSITAQFPWLVWEEQGSVVGYAYGSLPFERAAYAWCAEVSIYLAPQVQGKGIGRALYTALEAIMKGQGYQTLYAIITEENTGSLAFHQRLGYHTQAVFPSCGMKFRRWLGVVWMEKRLNFVDIPSHPPISCSSFVENDEKFHNILATLSLS